MQAGAYQNGTWVIGVAKGGIEEGVESLAQTAIIAPSGQVVAQATTIGDDDRVATTLLIPALTEQTQSHRVEGSSDNAIANSEGSQTPTQFIGCLTGKGQHRHM